MQLLLLCLGLHRKSLKVPVHKMNLYETVLKWKGIEYRKEYSSWSDYAPYETVIFHLKERL